MGEADRHGDPLSVFPPERVNAPLIADGVSPLTASSTPSRRTPRRGVPREDDPLQGFLPEELITHGSWQAAGVRRCWTWLSTRGLSARAGITTLLNIGVSTGHRTTTAILRRLIAPLVAVLRFQIAIVTRTHVRPFTIAVPVSAFLCGVGVGALVMGPMRVPLDPDLALPASQNVVAASEVVHGTPSRGGDASSGIPVSRSHASVAAPVSTTRVGVMAPVAAIEPPSSVSQPQRKPAASRGRTAARRPTPAQTTSFRGSLTVRSRPQGAQVFVNGRMVGTTPLIVRNQPAGSCVVRVTLNGHEVWTAAVRVVAYEQNVVIANLQRARS